MRKLLPLALCALFLLSGCRAAEAAVPIESAPSPAEAAVPIEGAPSPAEAAVPIEGAPSPAEAAVPIEGAPSPAEETGPTPEPVESNWMGPAADGAPAYQSLYPDFCAPQPFDASETPENTLYLTFDDGPSERTDEVLATLAEKDVKATFFVVGHAGEAELERMRRIVEAGHTIGMHSYTHDYTALYASVESFLEDFYRNYTQIRDVTGVTPTVFRFPGGSVNGYNKGIRQELIAEMERRGFVPFDWNITSGDAAPGGARVDEVIGNVVNGAIRQGRGVVLFHDSAPKVTTAEALGTVIDMLRENGFAFAPLSPSIAPVLF